MPMTINQTRQAVQDHFGFVVIAARFPYQIGERLESVSSEDSGEDVAPCVVTAYSDREEFLAHERWQVENGLLQPRYDWDYLLSIYPCFHRVRAE